MSPYAAPNIYEYPSAVAAQLRKDGEAAQATVKTYLPSASAVDASHWKPQKTTPIHIVGSNFKTDVTVSKRADFKKLPAAFRADVALPAWLTPEIWVETFYWRRKEWDHSVDPRTHVVWSKRDDSKLEGTTVSVGGFRVGIPFLRRPEN